MSHHTNIVRIKAIAGLLDQLHEDVVFVGGATVSLYADTKAAEARPTDDVDGYYRTGLLSWLCSLR